MSSLSRGNGCIRFEFQTMCLWLSGKILPLFDSASPVLFHSNRSASSAGIISKKI